MGLDISDRSIKYVELESNGKAHIKSFGEIDVPEGVIASGEIKNEEALQEILSAWKKRAGKGLPSFVAASLPEEKCYLRLVQLPPMKQEEIANAVRWEIEGNIPLAPDELIFDQELCGSPEAHPDHIDVVITAFPKVVVESYANVLINSGFQPLALELESQAIVRAVMPRDSGKKAYVIVDMGYGRTSFAVFAGGAIVFTATVEVGGRNLEEAISQGLNVKSGEAVKIKKEVGLQKRAFEGKLFTILKPALDTLSHGISQAVEYYEHHATHSHGASVLVDEIILTGGDANLYGLDTFLSVTLRIPVRVGDPLSVLWPRLNPPLPPFPKRDSLRYASAIGLAMRVIT